MKINIKFDKSDIIRIAKIAAGTCLSIVLAEFIGLAYSASAGIITLLSIQNTKKETITIALKRIVGFIIAVVIAYGLFHIFGYYPITFGCFVFIFIFLCFILNISEGIPMCAVLTTHFLIEKNMKIDFIMNEFMILFIGITVGIVLNLFMPRSLDKVKVQMSKVEEKIIVILEKEAKAILMHETTTVNEEPSLLLCDVSFDLMDLNELLEAGLSSAYENMNNTLMTDTRYYIQYFTMRKSQYEILNHMRDRISRLSLIPKQAEPVSAFVQKISCQLHEYNNARGLLKELEEILIHFKDEPNPSTREEFENRAVLLLLMYDVENFLTIKKNFVDHMNEKQIRMFWN
ncbi:MAG: aromatic acid exporter family protein [Anaerocolumna sp.]